MSTPPPPKPWERNGGVTVSGTEKSAGPKPWERNPAETAAAASTATGPAPRPWEQSTPSTSYGNTAGYTSGTPYSSMYGNNYNSTPYGSSYSSPYSRPGLSGSSYGTYGGSYGAGGMYGGGMYGSSSMYGGGMYGNSSMYGGGMYGNSSMYGGGMYGGGTYGRPMYGGGMYGGGVGGMYGPQAGMGMGMGMGMGPDGQPPPAPPSAWQAVLAGINGIMHFFGRLSFLVDENAHAVHFFISALLQLLDRAGSLYGEIARFILRVLFKRGRALKGAPPVPALPGVPPNQQQQQQGRGMPLALPGIPSSALPGRSMGPAGFSQVPDLPSGSHWENLWSDS